MTETVARRPRSVRTLGVIALLSALGVALLVGLGIWQIERLGWKLRLIAEVDARVAAPAVAPPGPAAWPSVNQDNDEYRHVTAIGHYRNADETLVKAVTVKGPGFWVMTPLVTDAGFTILIDRGFVPDNRRDPASRAAGQIEGETRVTGLLRLTEPGGAFLHANDPADNRWYSRDVAAIAAAHGLTGVAPYFIDADATPNPGGLPVGGLTVIDFPNNHLVYALTWFVLAIMLFAGASYMLVSEWRRRRRIDSRPLDVDPDGPAAG